MPVFRLVAIFVCLAGLLTGPAEARKRPRMAMSYDEGQLLPHPAGCPRRAFCGCGARKHLGIDDVRLNLATNWPRYYRGTTQVAVWRGHVAVIDRWTGPHTAMMYDYNSGGHQSRYHERDTRGARIISGSVAGLAPRE